MCKDSNADGECDRAKLFTGAPVDDVLAGQPPPDVVGQPGGVLQFGLRQDDAELLTTAAGRGILAFYALVRVCASSFNT